MPHGNRRRRVRPFSFRPRSNGCACWVNTSNSSLVPVEQLVMGSLGRIAKLGVFAGGTLGANGLQIDRREDGVLRLGASGSSFLEQRNRGLAAARAMKDVDIQVRHGGSPVVVMSICPAATVNTNQATSLHDIAYEPLIFRCRTS